MIYSTRDTGLTIPTNEKKTTKLVEIPLTKGYCEAVPPSLVDAEILTYTSQEPVEQIRMTNDTTDFLWYSTILPTSTEEKKATLSFTLATGGGEVVYVFINNQRVIEHIAFPVAASSATSGSLSSSTAILDTSSISLTLSIPAGSGQILTILTQTMGLQNFGAHLEEVAAGIVSSVKLDNTTLHLWTHTIGLSGEMTMNLPDGKAWKSVKKDRHSFFKSSIATKEEECNSIRWLQGSFLTAEIQKQREILLKKGKAYQCLSFMLT
jgi:hypothetical protein